MGSWREGVVDGTLRSYSQQRATLLRIALGGLPRPCGFARKKGRNIMAGENIRWRQSVDEARAEAQRDRKLLLIDLFNPN